MNVSYTKTDLYAEHMLTFYTLNEHILPMKCAYEMKRSLAKIVSWARVSAPDAKNWNVSPSITIIMGF